MWIILNISVSIHISPYFCGKMSVLVYMYEEVDTSFDLDLTPEIYKSQTQSSTPQEHWQNN